MMAAPWGMFGAGESRVRIIACLLLLALVGPAAWSSVAFGAAPTDPPAAAVEGGGTESPEEAAAPPAEAPPAPAPSAGSLPPPPPPPPPEELRLYGDQGTSELALGFGYSSISGFLAAGGFRYFMVDGVAPGIEATYVSGGRDGTAYGLLLGALRVVPVRTPAFSLVLTGRGGRVFLGDHPDMWGVGGGAGLLFMASPRAGLELGYEVLQLLPSSACADLATCVLKGPVIGLRFVL